MFRAFAVSCSFGVALSFTAACGPSQQSIYEGNVRFEHCYRLDLDLEIVPTHRRHCWEQWLEGYHYGQPRDRVEYARKRLRLYASGDFGRPTLRLSPSAHPPGEVYATPEAAPTSVHAPPPPIAAGTAPALPPPNLSATPPAPGAECADECNRSRLQCRAATCPASDGAAGTAGAGGAAPTPKASGKSPESCSCDEDYKLCMRRCYE